ncbi:ABC transporter substrate-binding protein [Micromonospora sp. NPDC023814]|uniref:ABC transporter substrate-binding protein n=1 Tax=Micromonospora sp. NPDC023814 TaxID=3154596 RepID=UPI0033DD259A
MVKKALVGLTAVALLAGCGSGAAKGETAADGVKQGNGVTDSEIRVALLNDFSGPIAALGNAAAVGAEVYFDTVNAAGGICGRKVVAVREDTKYDPKVTVQAYRAVSDDVVAITQLLGAASINAIKADIARDNVMTLPATQTGSMMTLEDIFLFLPPYQIENINGIVWAAQNVPASGAKLKLGVVNPADAYGEEFHAAARYAVASLPNVELVASATYTNTDEDFTAQVNKLRNAGAEAVFLNTTPKQTAGLVGQAAQFGYEPTWIGQGGTWAASLAKPLGGLTERYRVVNSVAALGEDTAGVKKLEEALAKYAADETPDNMMVTGWVTGAVTGAALAKACANKDLTPEGVVAAMENLEVDLEGVGPKLNMGDGRSPVSRESRVNRIDPKTGGLTPITDWAASQPATTWSLGK